ncbi:hypothetical protein [Algibacter pacificus]|uniref:hypothetical protein n=1 Tax=Algibacter pacificus TaxID=2599389 RepID=UPI0011C83A54|nr:hypothetical protein [Algibacter pacificus]
MIKQNPFSVYDFLGYLIPGSLVIYSYLIIDYLKNTDSFNSSEFIENFSNVKLEGVFFFVIISYTIGHLISYASSVTIEKYANWRYSYPSKYLLNIEHKGYWKSSRNWKDVLWRIVMIIVLFPCVLFDWIFGQLLGFKRFYKKSLDEFLQDMVVSKANRLIDQLGLEKLENPEKYDDGKGNNFDFHRIITHYAYENSKQHQAKMSNYVALYGFLRTLSFIFSLLSTYFFIRVVCFLDFNLNNCIILFILTGISYLSFMAFMKFYRRYTLEGLMIIVIDKEI